MLKQASKSVRSSLHRVNSSKSKVLLICVLLIGTIVGFAVLFVSNPFKGNSKQFASSNANSIESENSDDVVQCKTTKGDFRIVLNPSDAPLGVKYFRKMVETRFFDKKIAFFRNNNVMTQFGAVQTQLTPDFVKELDRRDLNPHGADPFERKKYPWPRGSLALIGGTQMLIVKKQNKAMGINRQDAIVGKIPEEDMHVIDSLKMFNDNIDNPKGDPAPNQGDIFREGWTYLEREFPKVDAILSCDFINSKQ
jgi:cyclophilin family peptidyl-prolyl cis-trans isomerase